MSETDSRDLSVSSPSADHHPVDHFTGMPRCLDTFHFQPAWLNDDDTEYDDSGEFDDGALEHDELPTWLDKDNFEYEDSGELDNEALEYDEAPDQIPDTAVASTSSSDEVPLERNKRQTAAPRWQSVPVLRDPNLHRFNASETTADGNYIRIGIKPNDRLQERPSLTKGTVYKFKIEGHRDNTLPKKPHAVCPPTSPGHSDQCKGRVELQGCFIKDTDPPLTPEQLALKTVSRTFINDCSQKITYGSHFSMAMEVKFLVSAPAIFVQIHGMPDHFSYTFTNSTHPFLLPLNIPHDLYEQFIARGATVEKDGYPTLTISIKEISGDYHVVVQVRSVYAAYTPKSLRCNARVNLGTLNRAKCCHGNIQDLSYVYAGKLGRDLSLTGWNRLAFELKTSRYNATLPTPGHVQLWINGNMQTNTNVFLGRNDAPERGGSGMYHKFGIYRTNSEEPINLHFRNVKTGHVISDVDARLAVTLPPINVLGTCYPLPPTGPTATTTAMPNTTASTTTTPPTTTSPILNATATLRNTSVTALNHTLPSTMASPITTTPVVNTNTTSVTMLNNTTGSLSNDNSTSLTTDVMSTPLYGMNATDINDCSDAYKYLFIGSVILNIIVISAISGLVCAIRKIKAQTPKSLHTRTRRAIEIEATELQVLHSPAC
ncbi:heparin lyase I family protein [Kistimonas asteriae]|uniref:heparin lyase I family protein n=1 Tax=Kistimonas asteriae TaxID=517724 RepID=UPI001BA6D54A|nr:heparin lyase I family protein [Kistimonas asteriae]